MSSRLLMVVRPLLPNAIGLQLPPGVFRGSPSLLAHAAALLVSLRPFRSNDIHRMVRIVEAQRVYAQPLAAPLLLEQGLIQRLWAILADRGSFSESRLDSLIGVMAKSPPDVIVRVNTPNAIAASRIHARPRGNSRYERLAEAEIIARLGPANALYDRLVDLYRRHSAAVIIAVPGTDPVEDNVARVAACLADARA